jgi:hypothetical protein
MAQKHHAELCVHVFQCSYCFGQFLSVWSNVHVFQRDGPETWTVRVKLLCRPMCLQRDGPESLSCFLSRPRFPVSYSNCFELLPRCSRPTYHTRSRLPFAIYLQESPSNARVGTAPCYYCYKWLVNRAPSVVMDVVRPDPWLSSASAHGENVGSFV